MKLAIISDIHYYSKELGVNGAAFKRMSEYNPKFTANTQEIVRATWDILIDDKELNCVLISGDLTNEGERVSHREFRELLYKLKENKKKVYVIISTHDYKQSGIAKSYIGDDVVDVEAYKYEDIKHYYDDFGPKDAISYHEDTGSYAIDLNDEHRLLALIDDFGDTLRGYSKECLEWIEEQCALAARDNKFIIAMAHHPIIEPSPLYKIIGKKNIIENNQEIINIFAKGGIAVYLTGHTHMNSIKGIDSKNNNFYAISTASLVGYPPTIRYLNIDKINGKLNTYTEYLDNVKEIDIENVNEHLRSKTVDTVKDLFVSLANKNYDKAKSIASPIGIKPSFFDKHKRLLRYFSKWILRLKYKRVIKWLKGIIKVNHIIEKDKYDNNVIDILSDLIAGLYDGKKFYSNKDIEYKMTMGVAAIFDSILKFLPINLEKTIGYCSVSYILESLFNLDRIDNNCHTIDLKESIEQEDYTPPYQTNRGLILIIGITLICVALSPFILLYTIYCLIKKLIKRFNSLIMYLIKQTAHSKEQPNE